MITITILAINQTVNGQAGNLTKIIEEKFLILNPSYSPSPGIKYKGVPVVAVKYESPTTILITAELIISMLGTENFGTFNSAIWEAVDLLKN